MFFTTVTVFSSCVSDDTVNSFTIPANMPGTKQSKMAYTFVCLFAIFRGMRLSAHRDAYRDAHRDAHNLS